jgi:DNA-binding NarL/FixJ family response regulator
MTITVLVADDQPLVRAGIVMILQAEPDIEVVGEGSNGREALEVAAADHVDVVVMDVRMPVLDGISATRQLTADRAAGETTRVLVLTTFDDDEAVYGALRAGASGFLLKHAAPRELVLAVRAVAAGDSWLDSRIAGRVIETLAGSAMVGPTSSVRLENLTAREREVLSLMALGLSNALIRDRLVLSEATVKTHISRILMKTGSHDRGQAIVLAYQTGLVVRGQTLDPT